MPPRKRARFVVPHVKVISYASGHRPKTVRVPLKPDIGDKQSESVNVPWCEVAVSHTKIAEEVDEESSYYQRKKQEVIDWSALRETLLVVQSAKHLPSDDVCFQCGLQVKEIVRCCDCGPSIYFCCGCACERHDTMQVLHKLEIWQDDTFVAYSENNIILKRPYHSCDTQRAKPMTLVDDKGRIHFAFVMLCPCETEVVTLVNLGFWPSSPEKPNVAFSLEFMKLYHFLNLECQSSVKAFIDCMRWKNGHSESQSRMLYTSLIGEPMAEYRYFLTNSTRLGDLYGQNIWNQCPACPKVPCIHFLASNVFFFSGGDLVIHIHHFHVQGVVISKRLKASESGTITVSLDANFGIVRKRSSGKSFLPPNNGSKFFVADATVDAFVESYCDRNLKDKMCSNFKAGDKVRSKSKAAKLDVTAIFGSACRHEFPVKFINMKYGERLAYPVMMIQQLLCAMDESIKLKVIYDIGCLLEAHIKKSQQASLLSNTTIAVPVFHSYGHGMKCQAKYSVRRLQGFGLVDGETMERLWSYLRRFARITKEMTPSHRIEQLSYALMHYSYRKISSFPKTLKMRLQKSRSVEVKAVEERNNLLEHVQEKWFTTEEKSNEVTVNDIDPKDSKVETENKYVKLLKKYYVTSDVQLKEVSSCPTSQTGGDSISLNKKLQKIEAELKVHRWLDTDVTYQVASQRVEDGTKRKLLQEIFTLSSEKAFNHSLLRKYSEGQQQAKKVSRSLKKSCDALKKAVGAYNANGFMTNESLFPNVLDLDQVMEPDGAIFQCAMNMFDPYGDAHVPIVIKRKVVDLSHLVKRCQEERTLIDDDCTATVRSFLQRRDVMLEALCSTTTQSLVSQLKQQIGALNDYIAELHRNLPNATCWGLDVSVSEDEVNNTAEEVIGVDYDSDSSDSGSCDSSQVGDLEEN